MRHDEEQRKKLRELDKRKAAAHEAGHVVVAAMLCGKYCDAQIYFEESQEELMTEWVGHTFLDHFSAPEVSVAGVCAEEFDRNRGIDLDEILELYHQDQLALSKTDLLHFPKDDDEVEAAFDTALEVLRENEGFFEFVQESLMESGGIGRHEIEEYHNSQD